MQTVYNCSVCNTDFDEYAEGGTVGEFGIMPVAFCPTCLASMFDMVEQMKDKQMIEELKNKLRNVIDDADGADAVTDGSQQVYEGRAELAGEILDYLEENT